ncbi:unnamed protein product, partial [Nesidiocoris tenuis]
MTQTSVDTIKTNFVKKTARIAKRDVSLMTNDSPTFRSPGEFNCHEPIMLGELSGSARNESIDVTHLEYYDFRNAGEKRKFPIHIERLNACPEHLQRGTKCCGDDYDSPKTTDTNSKIMKQFRRNEEDNIVNLALHGENSEAHHQDIHFAKNYDSNYARQRNRWKDESRFAQHELAFLDQVVKEELVQQSFKVQALWNEKKELIMHIHKAQ